MPSPTSLLFHATPVRNLPLILAEGLLPTHSRSASLAVYLTDDLYTAQNYAGMYPDDTIEVLGVDRTVLRPEHLQADDYELVDLLNDLDETDPLYRDDGWSRRDALDLPAEDSLRVCHQVACTALIHPWALRRFNPVRDTWERCVLPSMHEHGEWFAAASRNDRATLNRMIGQGIDVMMTDAQGTNALHKAAEQGHADAVRLLLDAGADPDRCSANGWNALHQAVSSGSNVGAMATVDVLLAHGMPVDGPVTVDTPSVSGGATALWIAAYSGPARMVQHLLNRGASPSVTNHQGRSVLAVAMENSTDVARLVRAHLKRLAEQTILRQTIDQTVTENLDTKPRARL